MLLLTKREFRKLIGALTRYYLKEHPNSPLSEVCNFINRNAKVFRLGRTTVSPEKLYALIKEDKSIRFNRESHKKPRKYYCNYSGR